ncbi:DJ-1/PfpI family protein [Maricaulis sp.]|uniref:DJ-1/PfpI family protein n=1 Tax=Maricaulis sp. TaxID=1486257 RepID=UPI0025FB304A|nr:DJ-1/PfpI family protein [Maricaulis sp.]MDF1768875.1 DJ-1/PfpI family protein [Maricaulis sp.]
MKHGHRPSRVAAFVAESVNVLQLQTATDALARHNRRAVLVSGQQSLLRGKNGTAEINFAVAETVTDLDESGYDALVLLEDAATQPEHATALSKRFADKGKPVIALRGSAGIVAAIAGAGSQSDATSAALIDGHLYANDDDDSDWKIIDAVAGRMAREAMPA